MSGASRHDPSACCPDRPGRLGLSLLPSPVGQPFNTQTSALLGDLRRAWGESSQFPVVSSAGAPKIRRAELRDLGPVELLPSASIAREKAYGSTPRTCKIIAPCGTPAGRCRA